MTITINVKSKETQGKAKLDIRRDLQGNYIINDHIDVDIVYKVGQGKIVLFPKNDVKDSDVIYQSQDRFFDFMTKKGIIEPDSVKGTAMIGVMEAEVLENNSTGNTAQIVIYTIAQFIDSERHYFRFHKGFREDEMERLFDPDEKDSTELGEIPQKEKKGSIDPNGYPGSAYAFRLFESKNYYAGENDSYPHYISFHDDGTVVILRKKANSNREYQITLADPKDLAYLKKVFQDKDTFLKTVVLDDLIRGKYGSAKWGKNDHKISKSKELECDYCEDDDELDFNF